MVLNVIALFFLVLFLVQGFLAVWFCFERRKSKKFISELPDKDYAPNVAVILPFRGCDCNFYETVKRLISQNYNGRYDVYFVSSEGSSKAIDIVKQLTKGVSHAHFVNAANTNTSKFRSDKVNNMLCGINSTVDDTEVYLFIDSDITPHADWIKQMVYPLQSNKCGVTTGSAWIVSENKDTLYTLAARYWDFLATTMITFPFTKFARGFSFGLRKETFEKIGMRNVWENAFHDNFTLSTAIRKYSMKIMYVPDCLVSENFSIKGFEWVKWIKRQALNTKVNFKKLWAFGFFLVTLPRLIGFVGFFVAAFFKLFGNVSNSLCNVFFCWPLIFAFTSLLVIFSVSSDRKKFNDYDDGLNSKLKLLSAAFFSVIYCFSCIWAIISNKMEWRHLAYHEKTPFTTTVRENKNVK